MAEKTLERVIDKKYRLLSLLGKGAMGAVYRAEQLDVEGYSLREVALKMVRPELSLDSDLALRFLHELRMAVKLDGPHTVTVYDCGKDEQGQLYYTMELVQGPTLEDILRAQGVLPVDRVARIVRQICEGLSEAHTLRPHPLVHRDLKPANIFLEERQGREGAKVGDFGIAIELRENTGELAQAGGISGTLSYIAPEQLLGKEIDHRADLYSLGVILYRMLSRRNPFSAGSNIQAWIELHHEKKDPSPLSEIVPTKIKALIKQLLAKVPADRPANALMVRQSLEETADEDTTIIIPRKTIPDVFVSYCSQDREQVLEIVRHFESVGMAFWLDRDRIKDDGIYHPELAQRIETCKAVVVMFSGAALRSQSVRTEMQLAWKYQRPYLPLLLKPTSFPTQFEYLQERGQCIEVGNLASEHSDRAQYESRDLGAPQGDEQHRNRLGDQWLPLLLRSLARVGVKFQTTTLGGAKDGPVVQPLQFRHGLQDLRLVGMFTNQIWPLPTGHPDLGGVSGKVVTWEPHKGRYSTATAWGVR